ncbi:FAD-dependent oxidoreductase [Aminobacter sp. MSH1]|uniref:NAD(P)/FAD-dependent oxidoreductase n=1 Tax=Aminobacter sp. MSH1 TaxID=374606 RepID=UPI000D33B19D|nr:FAD-dependent oxidoreductase [Aminobacter sp. MSH1]
MSNKRIVIVGAGHAGGRVAQRLAQLCPQAGITLIGRETVAPYERPPLSKEYLLGLSSVEQFAVWQDASPALIDYRMGIEVTGIDRRRKKVTVSDGAEIGYDTLVLASGRRSRRLAVAGDHLAGVHYLRTINDADELAASLSGATSIAIVGGGLIGLEVAAAVRSRGIGASVIEAGKTLLGRVAAAPVSEALTRRHIDEGVNIRTGRTLNRIDSKDGHSVNGITLSDGEKIACDRTLIAIGSEPESAIAIDIQKDAQGVVLVDNQLRSSDPNIFAVGDVASHWSSIYEQNIAVESWQNAEQQANLVCRVIAGEKTTYELAPVSWSDQYDLTMNMVGMPNIGSVSVVRQSSPDEIIHFEFDSAMRLLYACALGKRGKHARAAQVAQRLIERRKPLDASLVADPAIDLRKML